MVFKKLKYIKLLWPNIVIYFVSNHLLIIWLFLHYERFKKKLIIILWSSVNSIASRV